MVFIVIKFPLVASRVRWDNIRARLRCKYSRQHFRPRATCVQHRALICPMLLRCGVELRRRREMRVAGLDVRRALLAVISAGRWLLVVSHLC